MDPVLVKFEEILNLLTPVSPPRVIRKVNEAMMWYKFHCVKDSLVVVSDTNAPRDVEPAGEDMDHNAGDEV